MSCTNKPEVVRGKVFVPWEIDKRKGNQYKLTVIPPNGIYSPYTGYTAILRLYYDSNTTQVTPDDTLSTANTRITLPNIGAGENSFTLTIPKAIAAAYTENKLTGFMEINPPTGDTEHVIDFTVTVT